MDPHDDENDGNEDQDDAWGVFGSSSEDEDGDHDECDDSSLKECKIVADAVALHLTKMWLSVGGRGSGAIPLSERYFGFCDCRADDDSFVTILIEKLNQRGIKTVNLNNNDTTTVVLDGAALLSSPPSNDPPNDILDRIVAGGWILLSTPSEITLPSPIWDTPHKIILSPTHQIIQKTCSCEIDYQAAPWKFTFDPPTLLNDFEHNILSQTTVCFSSYEIREGACHSSSISSAASSLREHGFCVLRDVTPEREVLAWGRAAIHDLEEAVEIVKERDGIDLLHPRRTTEYLNYREMAMREDLRVDLRDGPRIALRRDSRGANGGDFLRGHEGINAILREVMNPRDDMQEYHKGNFGRWNFNGRDPASAPPDAPKAGRVGFVISLPGCADQAVHADTPHLWEHLDGLPPHYINSFVLATTSAPKMGCTAFVAGSHKLSLCRQFTADEDKRAMYRNLVRPKLTPRDVLLFDCRILHFGLANNSEQWRPMMYVNWTQGWFTDPKNWDDEKILFRDGAK